MALKRLYELHEMTHLWQSIGREEVRPAHPHPCSSNYISSINKQRSKERVALEKRSWQHIEHLYQRVHIGDPESIWGTQPESVWETYDLHEGAYGFLVIWDHWQGCLKQTVLGLRPVGHCTEPDFVKQYIWDDTSDEEV